MQLENNKWDEFLRHEVEKTQFEFQETYWQHMEKLLDEEDQKKKRGGLGWWVLGSVVLLLISAGIWLSRTNHSHPSITNTLVKKDSHQYLQKSEQENETDSMISSHHAPVNSSIVEKSNKNAKAKKKNSSPKTNMQRSYVTEEKIVEPTGSGEYDEEQSVAVNYEDVNKYMKKEDVNPSEKNVSIRNRKTLKPVSELSSVEATKILAESNAISKNESSNSTFTSPNFVPIDTQTFHVKSSIPSELLQTYYHARYVKGLENYQPERIDSITIIHFKPNEQKTISQHDAADNLVKQSETPFSLSISDKEKLSFYFIVAANLNKGLRGNISNPQQWGLSPMVGIGFQKAIRKRITLSSHVGFTYFNGLNLQKTITRYSYSFGIDSSEFNIIYQKLLQVQLPISIRYQLRKQHSILASLGLSYSFNTESLVKENESSPLKREYGYLDGFKRLDFFTQIGYQYAINKWLSLQLLYQKGLLNITDIDFFNSTSSPHSATTFSAEPKRTLQTINTQTRLSIGLKYSFKRNGH
jgi:hypothetical protein